MADKVETPKKIRVRAVATGYMFNRRIKVGEVFDVTPDQFSDANAHKEFKQDGRLIVKRRRGWMLKLNEAEKPYTAGANRPTVPAGGSKTSTVSEAAGRPSDDPIA
jgi:hypothetical protein